MGNVILHFLLLVVILLIFSKFSLDAVILGSLAIFFYQKLVAKK